MASGAPAHEVAEPTAQGGHTQSNRVHLQSLRTALSVGEDVFREAQQKAGNLPKLADVGRGPATLSEAINVREAKEEEKRRRELAKKDIKVKGKQVTPLPATSATPANEQPGLNIGNPSEAAAFWMYTEDYFRDVTQEDILALLPVAANPEDDDAFTVPFLGRDPRGADRHAGARGGQPGGKDDDAGERRGLTSSAGDGFLLPPGGSAAQPPLQPGLEPLLQGLRPDGRSAAATMLDACTDEEARAFAELAQQMGLLDEGIELQGLDRAALDALLHRVGQIGAGEAAEGAAGEAAAGGGASAGEGAVAAAGAVSSAGEAEKQEGTAAGQAGVQQGAGASGAAAAGEEDTNSSSKDPAGAALSKAELLRAAAGDFVHPYLKRILERPVTAYVLNPTAGNGSLLGVSPDEEEEAAARPPEPRTGPGRGRGRGRGDGSFATPGGRGRGGGGAGLHASMSLDFTPLQAAADAGGAASGGGLATTASTGALGSLAHAPSPELHQLPPLPPLPPAPPAPPAPGQQPPQAAQQAPEDASGAAATPGPGSTAEKAAAGAGATGPRGGRARSTVNYSALAGRKDKDRERELRAQEDREARERAKTVAATTQKIKRKPGPKPGSSWSAGSGGYGPGKPASNNPLSGAGGKAPLLFKEDPTSSAVAAAVAAIVAEGGADGDLAAQWAQLDAGSDVLGLAPDDEVLAEMLALQSELAQQAAINRARAASVLRAALADVGNQRAVAAQRAEWEDLIRNYLLRKAEAKRNAKREKREMERRQAVAALNDAASPKVGRPKKLTGALASGGYELMMLDGGEGAEAWRGATPGGGGGLVGLGEGGGAEVMLPGPGEYEADCLAQRAHDEEAVCCVCADGLSLEPNIIVFCERCDIAVHQACYGVRNIPAEEWLCWPCRMYEEQQRAAGVPQDEVRPKRWEMEARGITHAELPGGSHAVSCCLCPVRNGAFKRTTDGKNWCHVICGMWQEGTSVVQVDGPDAVEGMNNIKADRWRSPCGLCGRTSGAVVKCNYGHCQAYFHPLCGRRAGNYLVARAQPGSRVFKHRAYCHNHSEAQRNKDYCTGAAARASEVMTAPVPGLGHGRRGASSSGGSLPGALPGGGLEGLDGGYGGAGGLEGGGALMGYGGEAGDMSGFMPPQPVKRKSGRPPKLQKLLQLQQLGNNPGGMGMGMGLGGEAEPGLPSPTGAVPGVGMVSPTGGYDASGQLPDAYNPIMQAAGPGRPPLAGRLSMSAAAKRRAEAAEAAGGYGGGYGAVKSEDGAGGLYDEYGGGRGSGRATTSKTSSGGFGGPGARAGSRAAAGGAKGRGASAAVTATATSGGGRGMRGAGGYRVKEESAMDAESAAQAMVQSAAAAAAAAATASQSIQAFRARMGAPSGGAAGGGGVALTGLARLADLEHQRALMARFAPSSVRMELEQLRTLVDTVRRRERSKRQQYRLLGEALSLKDSDPAGVLAFLQEWEWQAEDAPGTGPFTPEDVAQAPPPGETLIGRMLAASGHVAAVSTEAAAADAAAAAATNAGGGGAITGTATGAGPSSAAATQPLTTTTGPGAGPGTAGGTPAVSSAPGATGAAAGGSAAPAPSISTASGAAPAGLLPAGQKRQRIPSAIALEAAASAQYGAVAAASPPTKRIKLKAKVTTPGSAAAAFGYAGSAGGTGGGGGSGAEPARTSSRSRGGATGPQGAGGGGASMSSAPGGGMDGEVGSAEKADGVRAAGPGRDWRRRVVMGPDGVWVPRGTPTADKQPSGGQAGAGNTGGGAPGGGGGGAVPGPGMYGDSGLQANAGTAGAQAAAAAAATAAAAAAAAGASPGLDGGNGNGGYGQLFGVPTAVASSFPSGDLGFGAGADADLLMGDAGSFFADLGGDMVGGGGGFDGGGGGSGGLGGGDAAAMRGRGEGRSAAEARPGGGDEEDGRGGSSDAEADGDSGAEPPPRRRRLARQASQAHYLLLRSAAKAARDGSGSAAPAAIGAGAADEAAAGGANRRRKAAGVQSPSSADVAAPRKHSERGTREPEAKAEAAAGVGEDLPRATRAVMSQRAAEELNKRLPRGYRFERRPPEGGDR